MKVMLRKKADHYEIYIAKKDLEEKIIHMEEGGPWGVVVTIGNGWKFQMPDMPADTPLPITIDARKLGGEE